MVLLAALFSLLVNASAYAQGKPKTVFNSLGECQTALEKATLSPDENAVRNLAYVPKFFGHKTVNPIDNVRVFETHVSEAQCRHEFTVLGWGYVVVLPTLKLRATKDSSGNLTIIARDDCGNDDDNDKSSPPPPPTAVIPPPPPTPAPTVQLTVDQSTVPYGGSTTVRWQSQNATLGCTANGAWSGPKATGGAESTGALTVGSTFGITCFNSTGSGGDWKSVTVDAKAPEKPAETAKKDHHVRNRNRVLAPLIPAAGLVVRNNWCWIVRLFH